MFRRIRTSTKFKILTISVLFTIIVYFTFVLLDAFYGPITTFNEESELYEDIELRKEVINKINPVFVIILCDGHEENLEDDFHRQMEQAFVLLKSAALLTSKTLRFIVLVDNDNIYEELLSMIKNWPENFQNKILLEKGQISYPKNTDFSERFRLCASARLSINEVLPNEDAVVYLDTDMIFLKPPEKLWEEFAIFNPYQMGGLSPCLYMYHPFYSFPIYGKSGLDAGVWMMNLTIMKSFPGGWTNNVLDVQRKYDRRLTELFTQDITNIIFSKNPQYLYELSCRWNYRDNICDINKHPCRRVESSGIFLLHGNSMKFYINHNQKFKVLFKEFLRFRIGRPLKELLDSLKIALKTIDPNINESKCLKFSNLDEMLTKSLEKTILQGV